MSSQLIAASVLVISIVIVLTMISTTITTTPTLIPISNTTLTPIPPPPILTLRPIPSVSPTLRTIQLECVLTATASLSIQTPFFQTQILSVLSQNTGLSLASFSVISISLQPLFSPLLDKVFLPYRRLTAGETYLVIQILTDPASQTTPYTAARSVVTSITNPASALNVAMTQRIGYPVFNMSITPTFRYVS